MKRSKSIKPLAAVMLAALLAACIAMPLTYESNAAEEKAISDRAWETVEPIIKQKLKTGYDEIGMCTGYLYWCLKNAYGVDWGTNSTVDVLEEKLIEKGITRVAEGTRGDVTADMNPGDIVIFVQGSYRMHCAILGEGGKLYHARSSVGVSDTPTLAQWMAMPDAAKNCDRYRVYRGLTSDIDISVSITKKSADESITEGNGCYSLAGAQYQVSCGDRSITLTTGADGKASGKLNFISPQDAADVRIKEIKAPKGYELDPSVYKKDGSAGSVSVTLKEAPVTKTAGMLLYKCDAETTADSQDIGKQGYYPQKGASLAGAVFRVDFYGTQGTIPSADNGQASSKPLRTWYFETDENGSARWEEAFLAKGYEQPELYYGGTDGKTAVLPLGKLKIREVKAPSGYLINEKEYICSVTSDETDEDIGISQQTAVPEQVIRGDLSLVKVESGTQHRMAGIPFMITALEEDGKAAENGENHIIVTDSNGYASTESSYNSHGSMTNFNDNAWDGEYFDINLADPLAGVWFGEENALRETKGALPYGRYRIDELPCEANEGYSLLSGIEINVTRNGYAVELGTLTNERTELLKKAEIGTTASDGDTGNKYSVAGEKIRIVDSVYYNGLTAGETYDMAGVLMDKSTGRPVSVNGEEVRAVRQFIPEEEEGYIQMEFIFDGSLYGGIDVVVFEELSCNGIIAAEHKDINDEGQTVKIKASVKSDKPDESDKSSGTVAGKGEKAVKTGDGIPVRLFFALMLMTLAAVCAAAALLKRNGKITVSPERIRHRDTYR